YRHILGGVLITAILGASAPSAGLAAAPALPPSRVTLFAGLQGGFLYRSTDDGATWQESDTGLPSAEDIASLAVGVGARGPIYAGTGGAGIFVSTDNGSTWQDDNGGNSLIQQSSVVGLAASPTQLGLVYAATSDGVANTTDGGNHWSQLWYAGASVTPSCLALDPARPGTLAVGTLVNGIFISTDSGASWTRGIGVPLAGAQVNQIAFDPFSANVIYAATASGIYQSLDGGHTWQAENRGIPDGTQMSAIAVDPHHGASVITVDIVGNLYGSSNGGASWHSLERGASGIGRPLLYDPVHAGTIFAGSWTVAGDVPPLSISTDGGIDWQLNRGFISQGENILSLVAAVHPALPTDPVNPPRGALKGIRYFAATGHTLRKPFLDFYNKYNGLKILGLPLTESYQEGGRLVQYFERAELTYGKTGVQVAPLGMVLTGGRRFATARPFTSTAARWYFSRTKHSLSGPFLDFWRNYSGALLFGSPISEPVYEQNGDGTHRTYLVQYFQNARMEYHPELAGTNNLVTLGQLGSQYLQQRGWL
ncbi:MAG: WD40/YVTN/BNR-like repeat-containing protein, partial [Chloroflexota bacterium]